MFLNKANCPGLFNFQVESFLYNPSDWDTTHLQVRNFSTEREYNKKKSCFPGKSQSIFFSPSIPRTNFPPEAQIEFPSGELAHSNNSKPMERCNMRRQRDWLWVNFSNFASNQKKTNANTQAQSLVPNRLLTLGFKAGLRLTRTTG